MRMDHAHLLRAVQFGVDPEVASIKVPLLDLKAEYAGLRDEILPAPEICCINRVRQAAPLR